MPLCPQITNTPITVTQTADFTVSSVLPVVAATTTQLDDAIILIDGKTKAYYQATAPTSGMTEGDIWFDTDDGNKQYYYNGTAWVSVQDTAIAAAQSSATAAQTTADGKNKIYRQTTMPTTGPFSEGDLWFDTDDDNRFYRYTGGAFSAFSLGNNAIASLSATKLTAGTIDASVITVSNINAGNISTGNLSADRIASASITGTKIAAGTITASNILASTITATEIAAGTITAAKIAAGTITATEIAAGTITAAKLATGTLSANNIETGTLSASVGLTAQSGTIGGWTITSTQLYTGTLGSPNQYLNASGGALFTGTTTCSALGVNSNLTVGGTIVGSSSVTANGELYAAGHTTTANAANGYVFTTGGRIARSTASSERYKENIVDLSTVPELDPKKLLDLPVRAFTYKEGELPQTDDRYQQLIPGFIAEEVDAIYPIAADYVNGPESWNDRMIVPALLSLVQDLYKRIEKLENPITNS
jgi:hypothetical protein